MARKRTTRNSDDSVADDDEVAESHDSKNAPVSRYVLVIFQSPFGAMSSMNHGLFAAVQEALDETVDTSTEETEIDLWLESPGGSANVAFKIALELRDRASRLRGVVPDYAKSAATLLLLGFDEIYMSAAAELGPLDVQVEHPDRENVTVSGLDMAKALGFLSEFAAEFIIQTGVDVLEATNLSRETVLQRFSTFVAKFLEPVVAKLDPQLIHKAANDLDLAKRYATILLSSRNVDSQFALESPEHLAAHLVNHYPAHEFAISCEEAKGVGLPVFSTRDYDLWPFAKTFHRRFREQIFSGPRTETMLQMFKADDLLKEHAQTGGNADDLQSEKTTEGET